MKWLHSFLLFSLLGICHILCAQNTGLAVGSPDGSFAVTPLGGASYTIPIEVPAGICGMEPEISITYDSHSGNGLCGWGCKIGGISVITRSVKDIYHDGVASGISHDLDDAFYLDGQRLIMTQEPGSWKYYPYYEGMEMIYGSKATDIQEIIIYGTKSNE